jgi:hypothetical protein
MKILGGMLFGQSFRPQLLSNLAAPRHPVRLLDQLMK